MQKILFPFRIGDNNQKGFCVASGLAGRTRSNLVLLNTFDVEADSSITKEIYLNKLKKNWIKASQEVMKLQHYYLDNFEKSEGGLHIKHEYKFIHGNLKREIEKAINEDDLQAVVLVKPEKKADEEYFKNICFHIIDLYSIPIVIVPEDATPKTINRIAFASNFNKIREPKKYFDKSVWLSGLFRAELHFLHIYNDQNEKGIMDQQILERINKFVTANPGWKLQDMHGKNVLNILRTYIASERIDLVFTIGKERSQIEKFIGVEKGDSIFMQSKIPVWIEHK